MSTKPQIELFLENESGTQQVAYPFVESDHVSLSNGMDIDTMIRQDVSMPTVAHEDLSFKVGVGDQDVSSAIVDSSVAEMTIKGQTYQNILPEPSTHVLSSNKEMFKVNEGLDPIVEVVDGVSKSAILSGNTLVNLLERFHHGCSYDSETGIYTSTQNEWVEPVKTTQNVKVNVPYTLFAKVNTTSDYIYIRLDYNDGTIAKDSIINGHVTPNSDIFIKTTVVFKKEDRIRFVLRDAHDGVVKISNIMVIEGDHTNQDIPYFEGMQSVKMPVLTTVGKNLFNKKGLVLQNYKRVRGDNGEFVYSTAASGFDNYFDCQFLQGKTIKVSSIATSDGGGEIAFYTINKTYITGGKLGKSYLVPENAFYYRFSISVLNTSIDEANIQIEVNSVATLYEPFKSNILTVNEEVTLRGIGDVKDTLDCLTGEVVERIGEYVLNGSEDIYLTKETQEKTLLFVTRLSNLNIKTDLIYNDKFDGTVIGWDSVVNEDKEFIRIYTDDANALYIRILKSKLATQDANGFKQWLSKNPITIQYELATESVKTVNLTTVNEKGETTHFMPLEGTMHVQSTGEIIPSTFDMSVPVEATMQNLASFIDLQMEE